MQMMHPSYPNNNGMAYKNVPTYDGVTVPRWYTSVTSILYTRTGPWTGSASQTVCRMQGKALPKFSDSGTTSLSVVFLTLCVPTSGFSDRLRIRRGRKCVWGTAVIRESFRFLSNSRTASAAGRSILKPSLILLCNPPRTNVVISGV